MTTPNPIEEVKAIRHRLGADAGYDIHRIFAELRKTRASSGRSYVDLPPRRVVANQTMQRSGGGDVSGNGESTPAARRSQPLSTWTMTRVEPAYFPPLTFGDEVTLDDFMQQWFGKHLRSMGEPHLHLEQPCDVVRLLTLPTFHEPRLVRIDRHTTAARITAKQTNGRGGYGPGRLTVDRTIDAPLDVVDDAITALNSIDFWKLPALDAVAVLDGTRYVIESRIGNEYHVIERASPDRREEELLNWINSHTQSLFPNRWLT